MSPPPQPNHLSGFIVILGLGTICFTVLTIICTVWLVRSIRNTSDDSEELQEIQSERRSDLMYVLISCMIAIGFIAGLITVTNNYNERKAIFSDYATTSHEQILEALNEKYDIKSAKLHFNPEKHIKTQEWMQAATKETTEEDATAKTSLHLHDDSVHDYQIYITPSAEVVLESLDGSEQAPSPQELLK